jgi:hypothetical protein
MRPHPLLGTLLLVGACGGGPYYTTLTATPLAGPDDAIACARGKLRSMGYQETSYDQLDHRVSARKADTSEHRADPLYRRNLDQLEITAAAEADGKTSLTIVGHTFAEFETHRGPTEEEQRASAGVKQSSAAIVDSCGRP